MTTACIGRSRLLVAHIDAQWEFIPSGRGYIIRCVRRSKDGQPLYLTTETGLHENAAIVASPYPVTWEVEQTDEGIRYVFAP